MRRRPIVPCVACLAVLLTLRAAPAAAEQSPDEIQTHGRLQRQSPTEVNKNVTDPVSTTWSLKLENDVTFLEVEGHGTQVEETLKFQPTMPVLLTPRLKLIARPEFTLLDSEPYTNQGDLRRATGVGDTILDVVLSPVSTSWRLGVGSTFVFPTANLDQTGQGKWQAGPAGVVGYRATTWLAALIAQQWWSFAGSASRSSVSELHLQYLASYFFAGGWSVGTAPTIEFDWRATPGTQVTFPLGPNVAKVVKLADALPVKLEIDALYVPVRPDQNGDRFIIQVKITPVIPALIPGPLRTTGERR